jgi:uncharacterized RDD family membrane protein YckC
MEQILDLPIQNQRTLNYAGFGIRFLAIIIDGILLQIVQAGISFAMYGGYSFSDSRVDLSLISVVVGIVYTVAMQSSATQATLGKMAVGIKVGDENGNRISMLNALGRYLASFLSAIIMGIGYLMVLWDDKKQSLHDRLAGTYVFYPH